VPLEYPSRVPPRVLLEYPSRVPFEYRLSRSPVARLPMHRAVAIGHPLTQAGTTGDRLKEGTNINKSLLTLGLVIKSLAAICNNEGDAKGKTVSVRARFLFFCRACMRRYKCDARSLFAFRWLALQASTSRTVTRSSHASFRPGPTAAPSPPLFSYCPFLRPVPPLPSLRILRPQYIHMCQRAPIHLRT
jgi:hypothetical protein